MVRRWFSNKNHHHNNNTLKKKKFGIRFFRLDTLRIATNNFSTLLGRGGFGSVYKGILPDDDGRTVAIKRILKPYDGFLEMVELMSHLRHRNLIQVIGCCAEKGEQILVYEFAEKGNVWDHLHNKTKSTLDWKTRADLCIGTARGLLYLHEDINPGIIHQDIKSSNILLDADYVPKISDFDLMYIGNGNLKRTPKGSDVEDMSTTIKGTMGYMDPDYLLRGELTEKVDVYSYGITILEIVTGRRVVDFATKEAEDHRILNWVMRFWKEGVILEIVDPKLTDFPREDVERFINVALLCTRATPELRPSMFEVVHMLYGRLQSYDEIYERVVGAIADQLDRWSIGSSYHSGSMPSMAFSISENAEARDVNSSMRNDCAVERQSREESDDERSNIVPNSKGECSYSEGSSSTKKEDKSCGEDVAREYFERSMEKIMRFQVAKHSASNSKRTTTMNQTMVMKSSSERTFMESVYPPFLSGEYRTSRVLYSQRPPAPAP